jgi:hypothetical protein
VTDEKITSETIKDQIPYYLTQQAKEGLVKALNAFPNHIEYYIKKYQTDILQGDGWTQLELINFDNGEHKRVKGILLTNSCDISLENKRDFAPRLTFAPIIRLPRYIELLVAAKMDNHAIENKVASIKNQKINNLFYLPKGSLLEDDYVALLSDVHTLPLSVFEAKSEKIKLFTLSQTGFYLFLLKLSVHFCRFHENLDRELT